MPPPIYFCAPATLYQAYKGLIESEEAFPSSEAEKLQTARQFYKQAANELRKWPAVIELRIFSALSDQFLESKWIAASKSDREILVKVKHQAEDLSKKLRELYVRADYPRGGLLWDQMTRAQKRLVQDQFVLEVSSMTSLGQQMQKVFEHLATSQGRR